LLRFHDDAVLRRIELAVLVHAGRAEDARQAVLALLAHAPGDTDLWRHLAWAAEQTNRPQESAAALEAALTTRPEDRALRQQLAAVQLGRGQPQAALATVAPLIGAAPDAATLADDRLMLLASRCAAEGGGDTGVAQARAWLALVPEARRSREQRVQMARLAVRAGDQAAARTALDALIAAGESDPAVLTWAAALAETAGDAARAEALYLRAGAGDAPAAGPATLRLAALYLKHDRRDEAGTVLAAYLARKPDDAQARALLTQLDRRR
jgi:predicted Zn-dependent protease